MKHDWIVGLIILVVFLGSLYGFIKWCKKNSNTVGGGGGIDNGEVKPGSGNENQTT